MFVCQQCHRAKPTIKHSRYPVTCCGIRHEWPQGWQQQPGILRRGANFARSAFAHVATGSQLVDDATRAWRLSQCQSCAEYFNPELETCTHAQCGCGMKKQRGIIDALGWASKMCPIGRWNNPPARTDYALSDITIVVVSFLRFDCLKRFLTSVRFSYPGLPIIVADQSAEHAKGEDYESCRAFPNTTWLELPYDAGISACRNAAIKEVKTPLVLLLDDDHILSGESPVAALLDVLNSERSLDLICGVIRQHSNPGFSSNACTWNADFENDGKGTLNAVPLKRPWQQSKAGYWFKRLDRYINCFLARKELLTQFPWNEVHKIAGEHLDHVLLLHNSGAKCAYTPNFIVGELPTDNPDYSKLRKRNSEHWARTRWNVDTQSGTWRTELEPGIARRASTLPELQPPNIVLLTVGHTGSSVVAGLFAALGWNLPDNDPKYNEPFWVRRENEDLLDELPTDNSVGGWSESSIRELSARIGSLQRPWLIKDPRFCRTLEAWLPVLAGTKPLLLYLERDRDAVTASWLRHGESLEQLERRYARAEHCFRFWPWAKQRISYEAIGAWAEAWRPCTVTP